MVPNHFNAAIVKFFATHPVSVLGLGKFITSGFHTSTFNASTSGSVETDVDSGEVHSEKKLVKRYKVNQGGDINMVAILGTVVGIKFFPMQSKPEREWAVLFIRTRFPRAVPRRMADFDTTPTITDFNSAYSSSSADDSQSALHQYSSASARVHVFDPRIMHNARRARLGDRLFVSGFLSYYNRPVAPGVTELSTETPGQRPSKICAVVAQRMVFMGQDPVEDSTHVETREIVFE